MLCLSLVVICLAGIARCDEGQREYILFQDADSNHDDQLTRIELENVFLLFDQNNDTIITPTEFVADWTTKFNIGNTQEANTVFTRADTNDDGYVDQKDLPAIFQYFDEDGDGLVDIDEFLTQIGALEEEPTDEGNATVDFDG